MTLLEFARAKRKIRRWMGLPHRINYRMAFRSNLNLRVVDRETGEVRYDSVRNTVTGIATLVDLINGTSADHLASGADLRIQDSGGSLIKTIGSQRSGYPTAATTSSDIARVTLGWEDLSSDAYNPDDIFMRTPGGTTIAESLNVAWSNKASTENWFFDWELRLDGDASTTGFDNGGLELMLDCITGASSQHFDGNGGTEAANMRIDVYDGNPGTLQFQQTVNNPSTQPTSTSIRFTFDKAAGGAHTWARVETWNAASPVLLYDDDIANRSQNANDSASYVITFTFS